MSNVFDKSRLHANKINAFKSKINITAISIAGKGRAWVANLSSDTMYMYDTAGKVIRSLVVKKDVSIMDMVVTPSEQVIVTNMDKKVRRVSVEGMYSGHSDRHDTV